MPDEDDDDIEKKPLTPEQEKERDERMTYSNPDQMQMLGPDGKFISVEEFKKLHNIEDEEEEPAPVTLHIHPPEEDA